MVALPVPIDVTAEVNAEMAERLEIALAQNEQLTNQVQTLTKALTDVLAIMDPKQHQWPDAQRTLHAATSLVVEEERRPAVEAWLNAKERG